MIEFKKLRWGNCFSYGDDNELILNENRITQLVGLNGHGKSSIASILEEGLYNKNAKGIKKADIPNRLLSGGYWIEETFVDSSGAKYVITVDRKSSIKVKLEKDGVDISSHTATGTFNMIKDILGIDFKVFHQIYYKSNTVGLEFLTATDTNRKKFLIELFSLEEYLKYHEKYKELYRDINSDVKELSGKIDFVTKWLESNSSRSVDTMEIIPIGDAPEDPRIYEVESNLKNIKTLNKKIIDNNKYKELLSKINVDEELASQKPIELGPSHTKLGSVASELKSKQEALSKISYNKIVNKKLADEEIVDLSEKTKSLHEAATKIAVLKHKLQTIKDLGNICGTCTQEVTEEFKESEIFQINDVLYSSQQHYKELEEDINTIKAKNRDIEISRKAIKDNEIASEKEAALRKEVRKLQDKKEGLESYIKDNQEKSRAIQKAKKDKDEWDSIYVKIDRSLPDEIYQEEEIEAELAHLKQELDKAKVSYSKAIKHNQNATRHNTEVDMFVKELTKYREELESFENELTSLNDRLFKVDTLKKAFSTNGLVAYKLENLVKELEDLTNQYLSSLSDGRFVLEFALEKDKLNVVIIDDAEEVSITALSSGELARVNCSTLLAIRKLMSMISKTKINILFLDEIINVLDEYGREKLVEVLNEENDLNTFLVSHGWTHPLIAKVNVVKEEGISRLEWF